MMLGGLGSENDIIIHEAPQFINEVKVPFSAEPTADEEKLGVYHLLLERQNLLDPECLSYRRSFIKFSSSAGIEQFARVTVDYDPTYQKIVWHTFGVWRNGIYTCQLDPARIQVVQRETRLEWNTYDKQLTHIIIPFDIRVGDVLEWSCSIVGKNPATGDKFSEITPIQWTLPIERLYRSYLFSKNRNIVSRVIGCDYPIQYKDYPDQCEIILDREKLPSFSYEEGAPAWYSNQPLLQVSEYPDWNSAAKQVASLFKLPANGAQEAQTLAKQMAAKHLEKHCIVQELLDFVLREVRYVHIGGGVADLTPNPPDQVLAQRFGDCKDKSLLLVSMLRSANIEAYPALVRTEGAIVIESMLPAISMFNHVIVLVKIGDEEVWIDPTWSEQYGPVKERRVPRYFHSLIVDQNGGDLVRVPENTARSSIMISEKVVFEDWGKPATLTAVSTFQGEVADQLRSFLECNSQSDTKEYLLSLYQAQYEGIEMQQDLVVRDDQQRNVLQTKEEYIIRHFPSNKKERYYYSYEIYPRRLLEYMVQVDVDTREAPIALFHPLDYQYQLSLKCPKAKHLPMGLDTEFEKDSPFFCHAAKSEKLKTSETYSYSFKSKCEYVPPEELERYKSDFELLLLRMTKKTYHFDPVIGCLACVVLFLLLFPFYFIAKAEMYDMMGMDRSDWTFKF